MVTSFCVVGQNEHRLPVLQWPNGDQTTVIETTFGRGRIVIARFPNAYLNEDGSLGFGYSDGWCYDSLTDALCALSEWNPADTSSPDGWRKHVNSGRYRIDGDARYEYGGFREELEVRARYARDKAGEHV